MAPLQGNGGALSLPPTTAIAAAPPTLLNNASHRHPVFFTTKLRRPAFALGSPSSPLLSPVAYGYHYRDGPRPHEKAAGPRL
jgi:hypothetical protein